MKSRTTSRWVTFFCIIGAAVLLLTPTTADAAAKNIILMISDGAGYNAFNAGSYYQYGTENRDNEVYSRFTVEYGCTTYMKNAGGVDQSYDPTTRWDEFNNVKGNDDYTVFTDSAAAATALYTGVKTIDGAMSVTWDGVPLTTIAQIADAQGKSTGAVSSVEFSHATPGAVWSHNVTRNDYVGIANEMIYSSGLDVIMGCGDPKGTTTTKYVGGAATWADITDGDGANGFTYVGPKADFEALANGTLAGGTPQKVIGVPQTTYTLHDEPAGTLPTLETMTKGAINVLQQNANGFFLMVEGGAVDWANHANDMDYMAGEQVDFNNSVKAVQAWIDDPTNGSNWENTLLIVTADHECGMVWGENTFIDGAGGTANYYDEGIDAFNGYNLPTNNGQGNLPGVQYCSGGHTNELVPLYAMGCDSELFAGLVDGTDATAGSLWGFSGQYIDNTDVYNVMAAAAVPEPSVFVLILSAMAAGLCYRRARR
ncbi:MAG: alkaline phosphatase [Pirellulales bacterium]|nr:alkaline phosphatase [Pirellulales bacterium]